MSALQWRELASLGLLALALCLAEEPTAFEQHGLSSSASEAWTTGPHLPGEARLSWGKHGAWHCAATSVASAECENFYHGGILGEVAGNDCDSGWIKDGIFDGRITGPNHADLLVKRYKCTCDKDQGADCASAGMAPPHEAHEALSHFPFAAMAQKDANKVPIGISLVTYQRHDGVVYPSITPFERASDWRRSHSISGLLCALRRCDACELWNNSRRMCFVSVEDSGRLYVLQAPPATMLGLNAIVPTDGEPAPFTARVHLSRPTWLDHGQGPPTVYVPCTRTNMWKEQRAPQASELLEGRRQSLRRTRSFSGLRSRAPDLSTIREVVARTEESDVGAQPQQLSESVHDGQFFAEAIRSQCGRCPNERRYLRMCSPDHN